jgi:eukaryotic-like serine/threonine-protein kinase
MNLKGKSTPGGWLIGDPVEFAPDHTGGYFSDCYFVEKDGRKAFLKALDIEKFDITQISGLLSAFAYESDLLALCRERKLGRIVQVLESDKVERDPNAPTVLRYVPFLIFELAEGDIRDSVDVSKAVSDQWRFRILHQTTLALLQLHREQIAHQDLKPSNVLKFDEGRLKLGDLGRSSIRGKAAPHDSLPIAGAKNYAPFEQRYGNLSQDWMERRLSVDVFNLGCLVVFTFTNVCFPEYVLTKLPAPYRPGVWGDSYAQVIVHIQAATVEALTELSYEFPERFRNDLIELVRDLCNPDLSRRGRAGVESKAEAGVLWLERFVSRFDILEKKARISQAARHA